MRCAEQDFSAEYVPSFREKFWRKLGFRCHLGEEPEVLDALKGWSLPETIMELTFADRFRLLTTGRLSLTLTTYTDTESPSVCKSRFDWQIRAPGDQRP